MSGDGWRYMDGQPRTCAGCGEKVTLKGSVWFDTMKRRTWHMECREKALRYGVITPNTGKVSI